MHDKYFARLASASLALALTGCTHPGPINQTAAIALSADFTVTDAELSRPLVFIDYGDMRFTSTTETVASRSGPRRALVAKVAAERPDALFLTGDVPWHGGTLDDYRVYREETEIWRAGHIRVYPVLGNHEFAQCAEAQCLENWWSAFPQLQGRRWYSVAVGTRLRALALDSNSSLLPDSEQRAWLEGQIAALPRSVRFVVITLHHPPIADEPAGPDRRPNEQALATYLGSISRHSPVRFLVCAAHVHNYERFEQDGVVYLVSGGGGAKPSVVKRTAADRYQDGEFPNFHYIRFELQGDRLSGEMVRLTDPEASSPDRWAIKDRFELLAGPSQAREPQSGVRRHATADLVNSPAAAQALDSIRIGFVGTSYTAGVQPQVLVPRSF